MNSLYDVLDKGQVSVFESPTGTGKSLSLLCGSLRWLRNFQSRTDEQKVEDMLAPTQDQEQEQAAEQSSDDESWVVAHELKRKKEEALLQIQEKKQKKKQRAERLLRLRWEETSRSELRQSKRIREERSKAKEEDGDFLVDEYYSDSETKGRKRLRSVRLGDDSDNEMEPKDEEEDYEEIQILYCSRTHSQISQFIKEMKKTAYPDIKTVSLGSRRTMCINESVQKLNYLPRINDKCLDMQKESNKSKRCEFKTSDRKVTEMYKDRVHAQIRDIEDIVEVGKSVSVCPYYGSRDAIKSSEVVAMPYNLLLQKSARESLGIRVKGNVVVIDEAHNIVDTISSIYSVGIDLGQTTMALDQLQQYYEKYKNRLKGSNAVYIKQIQNLIRALNKYLQGSGNRRISGIGTEVVSEMKTLADFTQDLNIDNINIFKIEKYLKESRLAQKLHGFTSQIQGTNNAQAPNSVEDEYYTPRHVSTLQRIEEFMQCLANPDKDGRVIVTRGGTTPTECTLRYVLLNPANAFREIVEEARAVILAGGTMEPVSELKLELFPWLPEARFSRFKCGHVIPPTSLLTLALGSGPTNTDFQFTYDKRDDKNMIHELGSTVLQICNAVHGGVVCFFPSYAYLDLVAKQWSAGGIEADIRKKKQIFKEPRQSSDVDKVLKEYASCINPRNPRATRKEKNGALLLAVVGGKMSEGINFADDMGRAVIMVGLPYAKADSPELKEKMAYVGKRAAEMGGSSEDAQALAKKAASEYYENLCMRGVNQSIGRAIRHKDDYAAIILVDSRYSRDKIKDKLPNWIKDAGVTVPATFGDAIQSIETFFREKIPPPPPPPNLTEVPSFSRSGTPVNFQPSQSSVPGLDAAVSSAMVGGSPASSRGDPSAMATPSSGSSRLSLLTTPSSGPSRLSSPMSSLPSLVSTAAASPAGAPSPDNVPASERNSPTNNRVNSN
ncbi:DEAD H (Asp-Glu-Ala-Asp His) box helicase 11 [Borealophlyctis nickersoniae]|nr:DEAD H (Asp-Glu-Ala-Asp His) box helicase 11 [Borealophlyctis nickersoniae]